MVRVTPGRRASISLSAKARPGGVAPSHEERFAAWEALQVLERMPQWAAAMLVLRYAEGYEVHEIADSWGLNINTAINRIRLARQHFERRAGL